MKKVLNLAFMMALALLGIMVSCNPANAEVDEPTPSVTTLTTPSPAPQTVVKKSVGFNSPNFKSVTGMDKDEFLELAEFMPKGPVIINHDIKVLSVIEISEIKTSPADVQTLVEYEYQTSTGIANNRILIRGSLDDIAIAGLPQKLRDQRICCRQDSCTLYYGGCIQRTKCSESPANPCKPSKDCVPCKKGVSVVGSAGDIETSPNIPGGNNRTIPRRRQGTICSANPQIENNRFEDFFDLLLLTFCVKYIKYIMKHLINTSIYGKI